jgi:CubicO group peptidase (beta-lactamase class C family)
VGFTVRYRRVLVILIAGFVVAGIGGALSVDWRLVKRAQDFRSAPEKATQPGGYSPLNRVEGATGARKDLPGIRPLSVPRAASYAQLSGASAFLVAYRGELVHEQYWKGGSEDSVHMTYSFQKTVMSLLVGIAIEDGFIGDLDQPLADFFPEWNGTEKGRVLLRAAMQMSSGFGHPTFEGGLFSSANRFYFGSHLEKEILKAELEHLPGEVFDYGNLSAQIVGTVLERATPEGYIPYLSDRIWRPIGAHDATVRLDRKRGMPVTYCCLNATARDWLRIGELIRNRGSVGEHELVPTAYFDAFEQAASANPNYGLFVWLGSPFNPARSYSPMLPSVARSSEPFVVEDVLFLDGAGEQRLYISRSAGLVILRIGSPFPEWDDTRLFNDVFRELQIDADAIAP